MIRRHVLLASVLVVYLTGIESAQAQITPGQIPVYVDINGNTMDSFMAQPNGNPNSPIQITDGTTSSATLSATNTSPTFSSNGVAGQSFNGNGVYGQSLNAGASGVYGENYAVGGFGVAGRVLSGGIGVYGETNSGISGDRAGVKGASTGGGIGVYGSTGAGIGLYGISSDPAGYAGVFQGLVKVNVLGTGGSTSLCRNGALEIATCSSSLRYKTEVQPFAGGLEIVKRLRPIAFTWKQGGSRDVGLAAEDVEKVEPLLTFRNDTGEVEGVKYNQLSAVFVNAFAEQQGQIQRQEEQIARQHDELAALKVLVCSSHPDAEVCR